MPNYKQIYWSYFGYAHGDHIPCEVCSAPAVDIHHIWARSIRKDLEFTITNLMALCRECHVLYGDKKQRRTFLQSIHDKLVAKHKPTAAALILTSFIINIKAKVLPASTAIAAEDGTPQLFTSIP